MYFLVYTLKKIKPFLNLQFTYKLNLVIEAKYKIHGWKLKYGIHLNRCYDNETSQKFKNYKE